MTEKKRRSRRENLLGYLIISPWLAGLLVFTFIPMVYSLYLSFTNFDGISTPKWIGLDNYMRMFQDERFFISLKVTFTYVALLVPLRLAFALLIAMLLNSNHRGLGIYRSVFYLPSLLGGSVAIAIMWDSCSVRTERLILSSGCWEEKWEFRGLGIPRLLLGF